MLNLQRGSLSKESILEAVENQLHDRSSFAPQKTYERLTIAGSSADEAKRLIAVALVYEAKDMMREERNFDWERYDQLLQKLPVMPWI